MKSLDDFFNEHKKVALAFSGGVDSSYLLYRGIKAGIDIKAYYVKSEFQPAFEYEDALKLSEELGAKIKVIKLSVLGDDNVCANGPRRCYFCKKVIFSKIQEAALKDGYEVLLDGTNASDDINDRPGFVALQEMQVLSPLRICGVTKSEIRKLSKEADLFIWDKPAYACLATRIPTGTEITADDLEITEKAESFLSELGFSDFRVRKIGDMAKIQICESQINLLAEKRNIIVSELKKYYKTVVLDLEVRL